MVRKALILLPLALALMSAKGCQTIGTPSQAAAVATGEARAVSPLPDLDASCTAKVGRVVPGNEARVTTIQRWMVVADIRDRQAEDCGAWWDEYRARTAKQ